MRRESHRGESNPQPPLYESGALPIELRWRGFPWYWPTPGLSTSAAGRRRLAAGRFTPAASDRDAAPPAIPSAGPGTPREGEDPPRPGMSSGLAGFRRKEKDSGDPRVSAASERGRPPASCLPIPPCCRRVPPMVRTSRLASGVALAILSLLSPGPARAQVPQHRLQSVFPAGGRAGDTVEIALAGTDLEGVDELWFDHPGLRGFHLKGTTFKVAIAPGTAAGLRDVRVVGPLGVSNPRTFVVGDRPEAREAEPNNRPEQANPIALNSVVNGRMDVAADVDCFAFEGRAGQARLPRGRRPPDRQPDRRRPPRVRPRRPRPGRRRLRSLRPRPVPGPDPAGRRPLRRPAPRRDLRGIGRPRLSADPARRPAPRCDPADGRPAGDRQTFTLLGRNLGGEPAPDLVVDGVPLERKTFTIVPPADFEPDPSGPAFDLLLSPAAGRRGFEYRLPGPSGLSNPVFIAEALDPVLLEREPNDDDAHAQEVPLPCDVSGIFGTPGDRDVYRFAGRKGDVWWIEVSAERLGSPADPAFLLQKVVAAAAPQDLAVGDDLPDAGHGPPVPHGDGRRGRALAGPGGRDLSGGRHRPLRLAARRPPALLSAEHPPRARPTSGCSSCPTARPRPGP